MRIEHDMQWIYARAIRDQISIAVPAFSHGVISPLLPLA